MLTTPSNRTLLLLGFGLIVLLYVPLFLLGEHSYIVVYDNLDSEFLFVQMMQQSGLLAPWAEGDVPYIMGGVSTQYFHSPCSLVRVFFYLLPAYWAYVVNSLLVAGLGWLGVYVLARDHWRSSQSRPWLLLLLGMSFALLPTYPMFGASALGQPLMVWAFLNLQKGQRRWASWAAITFFPFYSHFALIGPFLLGALALYALIEKGWFKRRVPLEYVGGMVWLTVLYLLANQAIITAFLSPEMVSHRSEWSLGLPDVATFLKETWQTLMKGYTHAASYQLLPILLLVAWAVVRQSTHWKALLGWTGILVLLALIWNAYPFLAKALEDQLHLLTSFQFRRVAFLLPMVVLTLLLLAYRDQSLNLWVLYGLIGAFGLLSVAKNRELSYNWAKVILPAAYTDHLPTYTSFFGAPLFDQIKTDLGDPTTYRVVSLGFFPSIPQYNGFYTLDGYLNPFTQTTLQGHHRPRVGQK